MDMFKQYFEELEKVRTQLLEGAITYEEFFNRVVHEATVLVSSNAYFDYIEAKEQAEEKE